MLNVENLHVFRSNVAHKEEIREANIGHNTISFCYMVSAEGTFDDAWSRECRGITFDAQSGVVNGRPLHKFFNVGERDETRVENLDWTKVVRVMDKRDGSMIHAVRVGCGFELKSKKTFDSDVAKAAMNWVRSTREGAAVHHFIFACFVQNWTPIFEWTAPDARIVLFYPEAELRVLHVRNNETGEYLDGEVLKAFAEASGVKVVDEVDEFFVVPEGAQFLKREFDIKKMLEAAETREGIEGWIVQFESGEMVKVKTKWYLERHRAMTFLRERDIAEAVLNESLDDLKSLLVSEGVNIDEILKIEELVLQFMRTLAHSVNTIVDAHKDMTRKDFAMKFNGHEVFGLLMKRFNGQEPDYKVYFERNVLKQQFTLRQLVLVPSVAEGD